MLLAVAAICFWIVVGLLELLGRHHAVEVWLAIAAGILTAIAVLTHHSRPGWWPGGTAQQ